MTATYPESDREDWWYDDSSRSDRLPKKQSFKETRQGRNFEAKKTRKPYRSRRQRYGRAG
jgi:hypothetical protein